MARLEPQLRRRRGIQGRVAALQHGNAEEAFEMIVQVARIDAVERESDRGVGEAVVAVLLPRESRLDIGEVDQARAEARPDPQPVDLVDARTFRVGGVSAALMRSGSFCSMKMPGHAASSAWPTARFASRATAASRQREGRGRVPPARHRRSWSAATGGWSAGPDMAVAKFAPPEKPATGSVLDH